MKTILILISFILISCGEKARTYIKTEEGLVSYRSYNCQFGVLLNNDYLNVYNVNNKPIKCSGKINLTKYEADVYNK